MTVKRGILSCYAAQSTLTMKIRLNIKALFQPPVHWAAIASISAFKADDYVALLSHEEQQRAQRYRKIEDRHRSILAHALKRVCLAKILNTPTDTLIFEATNKGKPVCKNKNAPHFNLSHSGEFVAVALSSNGEIGVDVERCERTYSEALYERVLSKKQIEQVRQAADASLEFFNFWTQKEALSKAVGLGLGIDFTTLECSGRLGHSQAEINHQSFTLDTRLCHDQHLLSVASTVDAPLYLYEIKSWQSLEIRFETLAIVK